MTDAGAGHREDAPKSLFDGGALEKAIAMYAAAEWRRGVGQGCNSAVRAKDEAESRARLTELWDALATRGAHEPLSGGNEPPPSEPTVEHHYSGWPGAWCLDCGDSDVLELALACPNCAINCAPEDATVDKLCPKHEARIRACPEPGSNRHNPYVKREPR